MGSVAKPRPHSSRTCDIRLDHDLHVGLTSASLDAMTQPNGNPLWLVYDDGSVEELRAAGWRDYLKLTGAPALGLAVGGVIVAIVTRLMLS